jgi:hypothetical protein
LTTNVFGHVEQNLLVKNTHFIADSERARKVDQCRFFIGAEQTGFKWFFKHSKNQQVLKIWSKLNNF